MKDFMNVCRTPSALCGWSLIAASDVLEPGPTMLHRLRDGFHIEELAWKGGGLCDEVR